MTLGDRLEFGEGFGDADCMLADHLHVYLWRSDDEGVTVNVTHHEDEPMVMTLPESLSLEATLRKINEAAGACAKA